MERIGVIGSGSWGTALAILLAENGHEVTLWSYKKEESESIAKYRENKEFLPGVGIPQSIQLTSCQETVVKNNDLLILAIPSSFLRSNLESFKPYIKPEQILVNVAKGLEDKTFFTLADIIEDVLPNNACAVLSGPSHAEEVGHKIPTTCVVSSKSKSTAERVQNAFMSQFFRVYTNPDILGVELGGALKNVIALAAGISDGLGFGDNTKAALMTRGMAEISRLGIAMGADVQTFNGLSGIGDLIVTCTSMHSRNRRAGILIGKGKALQDVLNEVHMVVEGVHTAKAALSFAKKFNVEMPITEQINKVLFEGESAKTAVDNLMVRDKRSEDLSTDLVAEQKIGWSKK